MVNDDAKHGASENGMKDKRKVRSAAQFVVPQLESALQHTPGLHRFHRLHRMVHRWKERTTMTANWDVVAEGSRRKLTPELFYCRMPRSIVAAAPRALWNFSYGIAFSPMILVGCVGGGLLRGGPVGLLRGTLEGSVLGLLWLGLGTFTAASQIAGGAFNTATAPYWYYGSLRQWHPVHHAWRRPTTARDEELAMLPSDGELWETMMDRRAQTKEAKTADGHTQATREYYRLLGVTDSATQTEIKRGFLRTSMVVHPDKNPSLSAQEEFDRLKKAYKVLADPIARKKYDAGGEKALENGMNGHPDRRDTLRSIFGGDSLRELVGDVRTSRFARRMVDQTYYNDEEVSILNARVLDTAVATLLGYLIGHPGPQQTELNGNSSVEKDLEGWEIATKTKVLAFANIGIAKEVMYVVGTEYLAVLDEIDMPVVGRVARGMLTVPHRAFSRVYPWFHVVRTGTHAIQNPSKVLETVWYFSVAELRQTARYAATNVALDVGASPEERVRRHAALRALGQLLVKAGKQWDGANDSVLQTMQQSAAADMRDRQRRKDQK